eukprot:6468898-Heterocapsa_arctica.AAC.1
MGSAAEVSPAIPPRDGRPEEARHGGHSDAPHQVASVDALAQGRGEAGGVAAPVAATADRGPDP